MTESYFFIHNFFIASFRLSPKLPRHTCGPFAALEADSVIFLRRSLLSWRWWQLVLPKLGYLSTRIHGVTPQETMILIYLVFKEYDLFPDKSGTRQSVCRDCRTVQNPLVTVEWADIRHWYVHFCVASPYKLKHSMSLTLPHCVLCRILRE
jgi:hypothetical protein